MSEIRISIIIVSWNSKDYLASCLESILRVPLSIPHEIIVVDNNSSDGSPEMIQERYPHVKLIRNSANYGFAKANNIGLKTADGEFLYFINSDVDVMDGCMEKLFEFMLRNSDVGVSGPKIIGVDRKVQRSCMEFPTLWNLFCRALALDVLFPSTKLFGGQLMTYWAHDSIRDVDVINGCFWVVRRKALSMVGPLDENFFIYAEDIDWCKRFHEAGWRVVFFPEAEAIHYGGASSANAPLSFYIEMQKANFRYWQKYHGKTSQFFYISIRMLHEALRLGGHAFDAIVRPSRRALSTAKVRRSWAGLQWIAGVNSYPHISRIHGIIPENRQKR